ncbi:MAG: DUF6457 domain-containing protein [Actinomycetes bacterium]
MEPLDWISAFAAELGVETPNQETIDVLLELAGVAAHGSQRIAAPIAAYLVGQAALSPEIALVVSRRISPP